LKFSKMQGIGNDYIYVNCFEETVENPNRVSEIVSNRRFGIGSDGLILIMPSEKADFKMRMFNADGSEGMMCGNGIRCVGKYVYDRKMTDKTQFISITHRRGTMEEADVLYGVTMQEKGVSKLLELQSAELAAKMGLEG